MEKEFQKIYIIFWSLDRPFCVQATHQGLLVTNLEILTLMKKHFIIMIS